MRHVSALLLSAVLVATVSVAEPDPGSHDIDLPTDHDGLDRNAFDTTPEDWDHNGLDDAPLVIETLEQLRDLAEIDGDPATFTEDEQMKFVILGQLLGLDAAQPVTE